MSSIALALLLGSTAGAQGFPNQNYTPDQAWQLISPDLGEIHFNQPMAVSGYVVLGGNAKHEIWDVSDPFAPVRVAEMESPFYGGEAESHQLASRKLADGTVMLATISGLGVDLWDLTDPTNPALLSALELEGIYYGDNTSAVWGLSWQGDALYVGGTNTGLHLVDTSDPRNPVVVDRIPTAQFGSVSAGPLFAVGNLLVVTAPKDHRGVATLDIGDPWNPAVLDWVIPDEDTYIGGYYEVLAYHVDPFRSWDVTTDPLAIREVSNHATFDSEYVSFGDGYAFLGAMRPNPGIHKIDLADPSVFADVGKVNGRTDVLDGLLTDDQFSLKVNNLLVVCDDEIQYGCVLGVHDTQPDFVPLQVATVNPPDGAANQPITSRIGLSLSDQVDSRSVDAGALELRSLADGTVVPGSWGLTATELAFWPDAALEPDTTYEIVVPTGGLTDLAGNGLSSEFRSVFSTGADVAALDCGIEPLPPVPVGADATLSASAPADTVEWDFGDGSVGTGASTLHSWSEPGRYAVSLTVSDGVSARSCAAVQVVHRPLADRAPTHASTVLVDGDLAWVVNPDQDTVSAVSLASLTRVAEVPVGDHPRTLAQTADGRILVANQGDDSLSVIDPATASVVDTLRLPWGSAPYGVAADGEALWVTLEQDGALARVAGGKVVETIPLGKRAGGIPPQVRGLAVAPDGTVWVSRFLSGADGAELYRLEGDRARTVPLRVDPGPDSNDGGRGVPNYLVSLTVSPDGARLLAPSKKDNVQRGAFRDGQPLDSDNTVRTVVSFVDLEAGGEATAERLDLDDRERLTAGVYSPAGDLVFVVSQGSNQVDVLDAYSGLRVAGFGTGLAPSGLALQDGTLVVHDFLDRTLSVFDVSGILDGTDATAWWLGQVPLITEEALAPDVLLGKQIFYNANTHQMSADGYIACATCHLDGGADGQTWDFTDRGEGLRNTIDLRGKAGLGHGPLHWTANFDEVQDFENDIRHAFGGGGLMEDADFEATADTLGAPKAGLSERLDALAAYVSSLESFPRSPHRTDRGELTDEAVKGQRVVERSCLDCHGGPALTDSRGPKTLHDVGTLRKSSGQRLGGALPGIDTPTLLGLWATAPYLHDGSAATLHQVLDNEDHVGRLSDRQKDQVVAFLLQVEARDLPLEPRGCGCATSGPAGLAWVFGVPLLVGLRRRR